VKKAFYLLFAIITPFFVGGIGAIFTTSEINTWYRTLEKPVFTPPDAVFGPIWGVLYLLIGISLFLILIAKNKPKTKASAVNWFFIQLVLNAAWSIIFFGLHAPTVALLEIVVLWIAIVRTIKLFSIINPTAGKLLWPYLVWASFAAILNLFVVILNK